MKGRYVTALIYLPEFYNPDSQGKRLKIEEKKFETTADEIAKKFGGGTWHPGKSGIWWDKGKKYIDPGIRIFEVDIPKTKRDKEWLVNYIRNNLLICFQQEVIYLKIMPEVIDIEPIKITQ